MFSSIGFGELAVICIVLIFAVGPERLPSMMKTIGKTMRTLRNASRDIRSATGIDEMMRDDAFDMHTPPRKYQQPPGPASVARTAAGVTPAPAVTPESSAPAVVPALVPAAATEAASAPVADADATKPATTDAK